MEPETRQMLDRLDAFLDELAEGHRNAMEQVVDALNQRGGLDREIQVSVEAVRPVFQKWSFEICFLLRIKGVLRFNQIKECLPGLGSRTLSERLKDLQTHGIVQREVHAEVPVRVEYRLTPKGMRLGDLIMPMVAHLRIWDYRKAQADAAPAPSAAEG